jgi:hypothetical protein
MMLLRPALLALFTVPLVACDMDLGFDEDLELFPSSGPIAEIEDDGTNLVVRTCKEVGWFSCVDGEETVELVADGVRTNVPKTPQGTTLFTLPMYSHEATVASPSDLAIEVSMFNGIQVLLDTTLPPRFTASAPATFVRSQPLRVDMELVGDHDAYIRVTSWCGSKVDIRDVTASEARTSIRLDDLPRESCTHLVQAIQERTVVDTAVSTLRRLERFVVTSEP